MAKKRNFAAKAFEKATGTPLGHLTDRGHIMAMAHKDRGGTVRKLLLIANGSGDPASRARAKALIAAIKREMGPS